MTPTTLLGIGDVIPDVACQVTDLREAEGSTVVLAFCQNTDKPYVTYLFDHGRLHGARAFALPEAAEADFLAR